MENKRTVRGILYSKALDALEKTELSEMARYSAAVGATFAMTAALAYPELVKDAATLVLSWENWILPKAALSAAVCFNFRAVWKRALEEMKPVNSVRPEMEESIEGIPTIEIIHHLFENGTFSVKDAKAFALPMARYEALSKRLEEIGLLVRGEKNARVLNPEWARSDVVSVFAGCRTAEELKPLTRKDGENSFVHSPSLGFVRAKLEEMEIPRNDAEKLAENGE